MLYYICERWNIAGDVETHDETDCKANKVKTLKEVRAWIRDWISTWKENAKENGYRVTSVTTDFKTFARIRIREEDCLDTFSLKVVNPDKKSKVRKWKYPKGDGNEER